MHFIQKLLKHLGVGLFSASSGIAVFVSTLLTFGAFIGNIEALPIMLVAGLILLATTTGIFASLNTYFFQGKEILKNSEADLLSAEKHILLSSTSSSKSNLSVPMQLSFTTINSAIIFFNRLFTINTCFWLFDLYPPIPLILLPCFIDSAIKLGFTLTNENLAGCQTIATWLEKREHDNYFYKPLIEKLAQHKILAQLLVHIGSLEHTLMDDIIPLAITVIPKNLFNLLLNSPVILMCFTAVTVLLILPLAFIIYQQTLHFEGNASLKNLNKTNHETIKLNSGIPCFQSNHYLKAIKFSLNLMGPLHAPQAIAPLAIALQQIRLNNDEYLSSITYWVISIILILIVALSYGTGIHCSEVKEAKASINETLESLSFFDGPKKNLNAQYKQSSSLKLSAEINLT